MPRIFLSPSLQDGNLYAGGGNEKYYMNLIADAMIPFLNSSGIAYTRAPQNATLTEVINLANRGSYDLYLALHSNAAPPGSSGTVQGIDCYYYTNSRSGKKFADIMVTYFKGIYPNPSKVRAVPNSTFAELRRTKAPASLLEIGYHDNPTDAQWIRDNIDTIAYAIVSALAYYFEIPFIPPTTAQIGIVQTNGANLNVRAKPSTLSPVISRIANGTQVIVYGKIPDWYVVGHCNVIGYASDQYIVL